MKLAVIINPTAGRGTAKRIWPRLATIVEESLGPHETCFTERSAHATELARRALCSGTTTVLSVGGDGTHSEVVNGFFDRGQPVNPDACLGILPVGTGSDLARSLGIPRATMEATAALRDAAPQPVDVILCTCTDAAGSRMTRYALNGVDCGFGAVVAEKVNRSSKLVGGFVPYLMASLSALVRWHNVEVRITLDDSHTLTGPVMDVAVANGQFTGGGMHVAPRASMNDGRLDVVIVGNVGKCRALSYLPSLYGNRILDRSGVTWRQCRQVTVESDQEVFVALDGEQVGRLPATFDVLPGALRLLVPARTAQ